MQIFNKLRWITDLTRVRHEAFYPSLARRLGNSHEYFMEEFTIRHEKITEDLFLNEIVPLYEKEIAGRDNYIFQNDEIKNKYLEKLRSGREYFWYGLYEKKSGTAAGGHLYSIPRDIVSVGMRVFDRTLNKNTKAQATIDFWAEWMFYDFMKESGNKKYSLGVDHYPNLDRAGLPLYKLKVGARPFIDVNSENTEINLSTLKFSQQALFFDEKNDDGRMQKLYVYYRDYKPGGVLDELEKVAQWSGIAFELNGANQKA